MLLSALHYLPSLEYMSTLLLHDNCIIDIHENYQKQSYRNRCYILSSHGTQVLSIPIIKGNSKQKIKDVKIDYDQKWLNVHWRSITSAYGKAPFFDYYIQYFEDIFFKKEKYLLDLNQQLLEICIKLLGIKTHIAYSSQYVEANKSYMDTRDLIKPKTDFLPRLIYQPKPYFQMFGDQFVPNLSVLDLLFCEGTAAKSILEGSLVG